MAAQTMMLMSGVSTQALGLKRLDLIIQKSKCSPLFFSPLPLPSHSSSQLLRTLALFKSKPKAAPKKVEKPKLKVEDGLFGTSGGIGFTKENELFVGRVAMIGFADTTKDGNEEARKFLMSTVTACLLALVAIGYTPPSVAIEAGRGGALFRQSCIGCHSGGGNVIQPGATLFSKDLERNGVDSEEEIYNITYGGKGRMPGFGVNCMPRGQCTFGPRLQDEEIKALAEFVKSQADQGWPTSTIY